MEKYHFAKSPAIDQMYRSSQQASQVVLNSFPPHQEEQHPVNLQVFKFRFTASRAGAASHSGVTMGGCDDSWAMRSPGRGRPGQPPAAAFPPGPAALVPRPITCSATARKRHDPSLATSFRYKPSFRR